MAVSRFKHLLAGVICTVAIAGTAGLAYAEPTALTSSMQACLSANSFGAVLAMSFAKTAAERHVGDDVGLAMAKAWGEFFRLKCDLRAKEWSAAREYLVAEWERKKADPAPVSEKPETEKAAVRATKPGPREIPLCVGNCR